jgi:hypothetical protein
VCEYSLYVVQCYRYSSMSALGITHCTLRDTHIGTMPIPANTPVIFNYYSAHYDETTFTQPHTFDPSRFLNASTGVWVVFLFCKKFLHGKHGGKHCVWKTDEDTLLTSFYLFTIGNSQNTHRFSPWAVSQSSFPCAKSCLHTTFDMYKICACRSSECSANGQTHAIRTRCTTMWWWICGT